MNKKSFALAIKMLTSNYETGLDLKNDEDKARVSSLFGILKAKGFTDQDVNEAVMDMMEKEPSLFGKKLPPLAWFFTYGKQELDPAQQADIEAERILDEASYPCPILFDNEITNAALHSYGGIGKVYFDLYDSFNPKPKQRTWVKKELREIWLDCQSAGKRRNFPSRPAISSKRDSVSFVGDKAKCQELLDSSQIPQVLEEPRNEEVEKVIAKLEEGWKDKRKIRRKREPWSDKEGEL